MPDEMVQYWYTTIIQKTDIVNLAANNNVHSINILKCEFLLLAFPN